MEIVFKQKVSEVTQESGIKLEAFPVQYSFPYGPNWDRIGYYNEAKFGFIRTLLIWEMIFMIYSMMQQLPHTIHTHQHLKIIFK